MHQRAGLFPWPVGTSGKHFANLTGWLDEPAGNSSDQVWLFIYFIVDAKRMGNASFETRAAHVGRCIKNHDEVDDERKSVDRRPRVSPVLRRPHAPAHRHGFRPVQRK